MKSALLVILTIPFFLVPSLFGQDLSRATLNDNFSNLSQLPDDRLVDIGEIFEENEGERLALSQRLESLEKQYEFSVYFVAYSGIIGSNVLEKAEQFRDSWLGSEKEGLIFVCDTDMKVMAHSFTKVDGLPLDGAGPSWKLPDHELVAVMNEVIIAPPENLTEEEYLALVCNTLADKLEKKLGAKKSKASSFPLEFLVTFAIASGLILLSIWWAHKRSRSFSESPREPFPVIEIPNRLGAVFGGGSVSEISFETPKKSELP